jgi:hypothetical protein
MKSFGELEVVEIVSENFENFSSSFTNKFFNSLTPRCSLNNMSTIMKIFMKFKTSNVRQQVISDTILNIITVSNEDGGIQENTEEVKEGQGGFEIEPKLSTTRSQFEL